MSYDTAVKLKLLTLANQFTHENISNDQICNKCLKLFTGIGKLKNYKIKLHIHDTVTPDAIPHRRIPFHLQQKVEAELTDLEDNNNIIGTEGFISWISPIVTPPRTNNPREVARHETGQQINQMRETHQSLT